MRKTLAAAMPPKKESSGEGSEGADDGTDEGAHHGPEGEADDHVT
jgi:hypothetical protein